MTRHHITRRIRDGCSSALWRASLLIPRSKRGEEAIGFPLSKLIGIIIAILVLIAIAVIYYYSTKQGYKVIMKLGYILSGRGRA